MPGGICTLFVPVIQRSGHLLLLPDQKLLPNQQQKLLPDSEASVTTEAPVLPDASSPSAAGSVPLKSTKYLQDGENHVSGSHFEKEAKYWHSK